MKFQAIQSIVGRHRDEGSLIGILADIQSTYGYLPEEGLRRVAEMTGKPLVDVYGVATFYSSFSLEPRGKHVCSVCTGTACHVRGSERVASKLESELGIGTGETTPDREFTLERVACLGACALGPIVVIDGHYFAKVEERKVPPILASARNGLDSVEVETDERVFPVDVSCPRCNHSLMDRTLLLDGYPSIRVTSSFGRVHGWLALSSLYGSYTVAAEHEAPVDTVVNFFCPHCHADLSAATECTGCGSPMVPMIVRQGGVVQVCSRRGCRGHMLDLDGANL